MPRGLGLNLIVKVLSMDNFEVPEDNVIVEPEDPFLIPPTPNNEEIDPIFQKELDDLYDEISETKAER